MNDLNKALGDISSIRRQVARTTEFRGYGPATLAATGGIAILAAAAQALWLPDPVNHIPAYLAIWISTALVSSALIGVQTVTRAHRMHSGMADEMIRMAVEQFLPAAGVGALMTIVLVGFAPSAIMDASRPMAGNLLSRRIFIVPVSAAAYGCGRGLVSAHGADLYHVGGYSRFLTLDYGYSLRRGATFSRRHSVLYRAGGQQ